LRVLGIDYGDRKIGLAISDMLKLTAHALETYHRKNQKEDKEYFKRLVSRYKIEEIVVGLPLRMDGSRGTRAAKTEEFALWLKAELNLPVSFYDERLTTQQAIKILHHHKRNPKAKKELEDQISAVIILENYLERKRVSSDANQNR
jgi:putative Holliday junction resolvase